MLLIPAIIILGLYIICMINELAKNAAFLMIIIFLGYWLFLSLVSKRSAIIIAIALTPINIIAITTPYLDINVTNYLLPVLFILSFFKTDTRIEVGKLDNRFLLLVAAFIFAAFISAILSQNVRWALAKVVQYAILSTIPFSITRLIGNNRYKYGMVFTPWISSIAILGILLLISYFTGHYVSFPMLIVKLSPSDLILSASLTGGYDVNGLYRVMVLGVHSNDVGARLATIIPLLLTNQFISGSFILLIPVVLALLTTFSRAAYLGTTVGYFFFIIRGKIIKYKNSALGALIVCLLLVLTVQYSPYLSERVESIIDPTQSSNVTRMVMLEATWDLWASSPWLGVGPGLNKFLVDFDPQYIDITVPDVHNIYLQILSENGIIGLSCFLLMIFYIINLGRQKIKFDRGAETFGLMAGLIAMLISCFFGIQHTQGFFWCFLGICANYFNSINFGKEIMVNNRSIPLAGYQFNSGQ